MCCHMPCANYGYGGGYGYGGYGYGYHHHHHHFFEEGEINYQFDGGNHDDFDEVKNRIEKDNQPLFKEKKNNIFNKIK